MGMAERHVGGLGWGGVDLAADRSPHNTAAGGLRLLRSGVTAGRQRLQLGNIPRHQRECAGLPSTIANGWSNAHLPGGARRAAQTRNVCEHSVLSIAL